MTGSQILTFNDVPTSNGHRLFLFFASNWPLPILFTMFLFTSPTTQRRFDVALRHFALQDAQRRTIQPSNEKHHTKTAMRRRKTPGSVNDHITGIKVRNWERERRLKGANKGKRYWSTPTCIFNIFLDGFIRFLGHPFC